MPSSSIAGCLKDMHGNLVSIVTMDFLIPANKVSYIEKAYEEDGNTPKGIRVFLEPPHPSDLSRRGEPLETVYLWIGWTAGGKEVWDTW